MEYDRHWMVVDNKGKFRTQREIPKMALIQPHISNELLTLSTSNMSDITLPIKSRGQSL